MTSKALLTLAARLESLGPFTGDRDRDKAFRLAQEARSRAEVRELFERLEATE